MRLALVVADFFVTFRDVEGWGLEFSSEDEESQSLQWVSIVWNATAKFATFEPSESEDSLTSLTSLP